MIVGREGNLTMRSAVTRSPVARCLVVGLATVVLLADAARAQQPQAAPSDAELRAIATTALGILQAERDALAQQARRVAELREVVAQLQAPRPPTPPPQPLVAEVERNRGAAAAATAASDRTALELRLTQEARERLAQIGSDGGPFASLRLVPAYALRFTASDVPLRRRPTFASSVGPLQPGTPVLVLLAERDSPWRAVYAAGQLGFLRADDLRETAP